MLLAQLRAALTVRHYSPRTVEAYAGWVRRFVRFHGTRHPSELTGRDVATFLSWLAQEGRVSAATQTQAASALVFLYRDVLDLPMVLSQCRERLGRSTNLQAAFANAVGPCSQ
jgi:hypothetical protein